MTLDIFQLLNQDYHILIPALWILGFAMKQTPKIPNWSIIWALLLVSIVFCILRFGFSVNVIINGIIATGVAVLGHQMVKQFPKMNNNQKEKK